MQMHAYLMYGIDPLMCGIGPALAAILYEIAGRQPVKFKILALPKNEKNFAFLKFETG